MTNDAPETNSNTGNNKGIKSAFMRALVPLAVILAIAVVGLQLVKYKLNSGASNRPAVQNSEGGDVASLKEGTVLPDFDLQRLDGKKLKFSELGSKVVLLNFWATWCEACVVEMPTIVKLNQLYKDKGFTVVAVNLDEKPEAVVPKAVQQLKIDFPVYVDAGGKLADLFDVHAIPLTILINKDRKVLYVEGGERDWTDADMKTKMDQWISQ